LVKKSRELTKGQIGKNHAWVQKIKAWVWRKIEEKKEIGPSPMIKAQVLLGLFDLDTRKAQAQSVTSFPSLRQIQ
jgi:hypothetical protein